MALRFLAALLLLSKSVEAEDRRPRLLVLLSIDQASAEYLERFRPVLEAGLLRLLEEGAVFAETHHEHAITVTAPGHAALSTGLFPWRSGIVGNEWFDALARREVYCVEDPEAAVLAAGGANGAEMPDAGRSPRNLLGEGLGDWMKRAWPESKVYAVAGKDRAAVLMGGKRADAVYWYDRKSGHWVTSRYYVEEYPGWVRRFHARKLADADFGRVWEPLPVADTLLSSMAIEPSGEGAEFPGIPKTIGTGSLAEDGGFHEAFFESPFLEPYLLSFAEALVREEGLGKDEWTDLFAIGFSSIDSVGHSYGPNSRELLDAMMRLDRALGSFLTFLDETVGRSGFAVALSSDHGVAPLPEYRRKHGLAGARLTSAGRECLQRAGHEAGKLSLCPGVARVWTRAEMEAAQDTEHRGDGEGGHPDPTLLRYARSYYRGRSPDAYVQLEKWLVEDEDGTTHGSPYDYDTHVPGIVVWPGLEPRLIRTRIATVDLPVTLASLLGIRPAEKLDGVDRSGLMR